MIYALRFEGTSTGTAPNFKGSTVARGLVLASMVESGGVRTEMREGGGGRATLHSTIVQTGDTSFTESGTITFDDGGDALTFSTVGQGVIDGTPETVLRGAVIWRVDGGTGRYQGASGLITSNFSIQDDRVTDHHWGVITLA